METNDQNTAKKIKNGDKKAFEKVFRQYYNELCHFALGFLKDPDEAEEIVQEVFFRIWNRRKKFTIQSNLKSYIYQSVRNACVEHGRHLQVKNKYAGEKIESSLPASPEEILEAGQLEKIMQMAINKLPQRCKKIFSLSRDEGLKYREIAEKLAISIKTVEADMGITLQTLRNALKNADK